MADTSQRPSNLAQWLDSIVPAVIPSWAALARAVGVDQATVSRWRRGSTPSTPTLLRLADATNTDPAVMLRIAGYMR